MAYCVNSLKRYFLLEYWPEDTKRVYYDLLFGVNNKQRRRKGISTTKSETFFRNFGEWQWRKGPRLLMSQDIDLCDTD